MTYKKDEYSFEAVREHEDGSETEYLITYTRAPAEPDVGIMTDYVDELRIEYASGPNKGKSVSNAEFAYLESWAIDECHENMRLADAEYVDEDRPSPGNPRRWRTDRDD